MEAEDELAEPMEMETSPPEYIDTLLGLTCDLAPPLEETVESNSDTKADEVFESWMKLNIEMHLYVFDPKHPIREKGGVSLLELVAKFDTMKYFREVGQKEWPSITVLARIHFSKMDNSAFQERVFSTAANAQSKNQARMNVTNLEKRTLIAHNKDLIRDGII